MSAAKRVETGGGRPLGQNPFASLDGLELPAGEPPTPAKRSDRKASAPMRKRGRVEIRREKSGRGGKTVTTATGFRAVCPAELEAWTSELRKRCGAGGTAKPGGLEIQGDRRDDFVRFFEQKGFRPVLAGG